MPTISTKTLARDNSINLSGPNDRLRRSSFEPREHEKKHLGVPRLRALSGAHIASTYKALGYVCRSPAHRYQSELPQRWKDDLSINAKHIVLREDMADFALKLLRREVMQWLRSLARRRTTLYIAPCNDWHNVQDQRSVAAVVILTNDSAKTLEESRCGSIAELSGNCLMYTQYRQKTIPVYLMQPLLGLEGVDFLKKENSKVYDQKFALIRKKNMTVELQMSLWRLAWYLA